MPFISASRLNAASFSLFKRSMMQDASLPLSDVINDQRWQQVFDKHKIDFGNDPDVIYTPAITLWALLSQVFFSGEQRSCKAAVIRVASLGAALGRRVCSTNTGAYCRARLKLPFTVIREIVRDIATDAETACPQNVNQEYRQQPETLTVRMVDVQISEPGYRAKTFTITTTIVDRKSCPARWIAAMYQSRWLIELDIRSIKCSLGMDILRAKTPAMVLTELWSCLLAYNLIRFKMLQSSITAGRDPRSLSFTTTQQMLATNWLPGAVTKITGELVKLGQQIPCSERVGQRTGRAEPRARKRRTKALALLKQPRYHYHQQRKAIV